MAWNGSGQFVRTDGTRTGATVFQQQQAASVNPSAALFDAESNDFVAGLENCLTRDGQTTPTGNLPMNDKKITGLAAGTDTTDAVNLGQLNAISPGKIAAADVSGTGDAILIDPTPANTAYAPLMRLTFIAEAVNTGAVTINVNSLGAKDLKRQTITGKADLDAGDIPVGRIIDAIYDGTDFVLTSGLDEPWVALSQSAYDGLTPVAGRLYLITS